MNPVVLLSLTLGLTPFAVAAPLFDCPPATGQLLPLKHDFRAPADGVVMLFGAASNEAEFRGCDAQICSFRLHRKHRVGGRWLSTPFDRRGMGQLLEVPVEQAPGLVVVPQCIVKANPAPKLPPKTRRKRVARRIPKRRAPKKVQVTVKPIVQPGPTSTPAPVVAAGPDSVSALIASAGFDSLPLGVVNGRPTVAVSPFPAVRVGENAALDTRLSVSVHDNGSLAFSSKRITVIGASAPNPNAGMTRLTPFDTSIPAWLQGPTTPRLGVGASGDGLNALDGTDIDAPLKRAYASATYDARFELYLADRDSDTRAGLQVLLQSLERLRADPTLTVASRDAAVQTLYAGIVDSDLPAVNASYSSAAEQARSMVEDFSMHHFQLELKRPVAIHAAP